MRDSVLVGDEQTEMFDLYTGVRQGCVMSPVLFSFFINGLAREIKEKTKGVRFGDTQVRLLLYADDIVLMAERKEDLQMMLDIVSSYSKKWRFRVNPKKGKSEVMLFGRKPRKTQRERKWWLAGVEIEETETYKYLGVELVSGLNFKTLKERFVAEARKRMMLVWAMGMRKGELPVKDCCNVWNALVRPVLEYGAVIWGDVKWEEAEAVQREMAKMILRCSSKMANEVVLGELGWWSLKARRDLLRLKFWGKMSSSRLVKQVYTHRRARYDAGEKNRWCKYTHALLSELGMEQIWLQNDTACDDKQWDKDLREKIDEREEKLWLERMQTKPKLRTYITLKHKLKFEPYLDHDNTQARQIMTRLRGGTNELRIETGRYPNTNRDRRLEISERRCLLCMSGDVENEEHFVMECVMYDDLRKKMFDVVKKEMLKNEEIEDVLKTEVGRKRVFLTLVGDGEPDSDGKAEARRAALEFCRQAMRRRNRTVVNELDQRT
jgi:Reverse transcriptase (RNA-dependent DNA polymerase)